MSKPTWVTNAGSLGTIQENETQNISLATTGNDVTLSLISGKLPAGMRLVGSKLVGTPFDVAKLTLHEFVIRASNTFGSIVNVLSIDPNVLEHLIHLDQLIEHLQLVSKVKILQYG